LCAIKHSLGGEEDAVEEVVEDAVEEAVERAVYSECSVQ
jgi:hypothetical protein